MSFVQKHIQRQISGFGTDLRELRELRGYSRETLSRISGIHPVQIAALEEENIEEIADPVYAERHVRTLVRALEGRPEFFLGKYRDLLTARKLLHAPETSLRHKVRSRDFFVTSRLFVFFGFCLAVAAIGTYVVLQAREISSPPMLAVSSPREGEKTDTPHLRVVGTTDPAATVSVNGQKVIVESSGEFTFSIDVPAGVSTLRVESRRRYSNPTVIERHVMFERLVNVTSTQ